MGAMQLHRVIATVHSPVVAQPHERDRPYGPEIPEPHVVAVVVGQDDVGELGAVHLLDTTGMEFRVEDAATPPASDLIEAMIEDLVPLYGRIDAPGAPSASPDEFAPPGGAFLVGYDTDGRALCGGGVKRLGDDVAEITRMFVVPAARGRGLGRALLVALEDAARALGYTRVRLDTGPKQPGAEAMYRGAGYREIANYNGNPFASFFGEKAL